MTKRELFESRVHAMACAYVAADATMAVNDRTIAAMAITSVRTVDAALAEIPHTEEPAPVPLAWRPMSEILQATGWIAVTYAMRGRSVAYFTRAPYEAASHDLGWIQLDLPPLPTSKL